MKKILYVATLVIIDEHFLMVYNDKRGCWELPGGKVEEGESPEEAAMRECREEAGTEIYELERAFDIDNTRFFVGKGEIKREGEMKIGLFKRIPDNLCFPRNEIERLLLLLGLFF